MFKRDAITWLPSPAKINLFLHICGRYDNGYHQLQSIFQLLDYGDELGFRLCEDNEHNEPVTLLNNIDGLKSSDNLIYKTAMAILPYQKTKRHVEISLHKLLPMGGGIGGGSSNAATTLLALNHIWQCGLSLNNLAQIGLSLGADVPIFVHGKSAFAEGVGEQLSPVQLPQRVYLVATPEVHVSTQDIFTHPDLPRNTPKIRATDYSFAKTHNDCEVLVANLHSKVANLLQWLIHYAPSRMTGTGASVFAEFSDEASATEVLQHLPPDVKGFVAKGVQTSPLHQWFLEHGLM